jgi:hypothetical protein
MKFASLMKNPLTSAEIYCSEKVFEVDIENISPLAMPESIGNN